MGEYTDEQIRDLILGKLAEGDAAEFDEAIAADPCLTALYGDVEWDLVADYAWDRLTAADALLFEREYLVTEARLTRLRVCQGLRAMVSEEKPAPKPLPARSRGAARLATMIVGLTMLLGLGCLLLYLEGLSASATDVDAVGRPLTVADNTLLAEKRKAAVRPAVAVPGPSGAVPAEKVIKPVENAVGSVAESDKPSITVSLGPDGPSESVPAVMIPPDVKVVNFKLQPAPEASQFRHYHAVLKSPDNPAVYEIRDLQSPQFTVDASKLESRTYRVMLQGETLASGVESLGGYTFRISR